MVAAPAAVALTGLSAAGFSSVGVVAGKLFENIH